MRNTILTLLNRKLTDRYHASGHWRVDTIYALASGHAQRSPTRPAARDRFRRVRCGELVAAADALSESLARHGVRPGVLGGEGASEASRERGCRLTIRRSDIPRGPSPPAGEAAGRGEGKKETAQPDAMR